MNRATPNQISEKVDAIGFTDREAWKREAASQTPIHGLIDSDTLSIVGQVTHTIDQATTRVGLLTRESHAMRAHSVY